MSSSVTAARAVLMPATVIVLLAFGAGGAHAHGCGADYKVRFGDTLAGIAARCGSTVGRFLAANPQIEHPAYIYAGEVLRVPVAARAGSHRHEHTHVVVREPEAYLPPRDHRGPVYGYGQGAHDYRYGDRYERRKRRAYRRMIRRAYREGYREGRANLRHDDYDDDDYRRGYNRYYDDD